jgi:peptide-methionine (S)-S-oxide reductase
MAETITLGGGCFWCIEAILVELRGVQKVVSGYAGGTVANPSYQAVCGGATGHAEVAQITYSPEEISLHDLLTVFFTLHDPTTLNRQGADVGTQYRSVILYANSEQKMAAEHVIQEINEQQIWAAPIVTTLEPLTEFYSAEDYHQGYFAQNAAQPYCQVVIAPKVVKLRQLYRDRLKSS